MDVAVLPHTEMQVMPTVRVLATRIGSPWTPVPRIAYRAQMYGEPGSGPPAWTCPHDHATPVEAQGCGVEYLESTMDRTTGEARLPDL